MLIKIGDFEFTEVWDGVLYKKLSQYPAISDWEKRNIIEFIEYEASHGRECTIECENADILKEVELALNNRESYRNVPRPALITECTACPVRKGCVTEFVCHTTSPENARKILECGSLLSAMKARNLTVEELMAESRNAANDPADYFEYIMLAWGNCQAGDRLVMERKLGLALRFAFDVLKVQKVTLGVLENNPGAYHCYKAAGFRDVPMDEPEYYQLMGVMIKCLELETTV